MGEGQNVTLSASNYEAGLEKVSRKDDTLEFKLLIRQTGDFGAQVITGQEVNFSMAHRGEQKSLTVQFPTGITMDLQVDRVH